MMNANEPLDESGFVAAIEQLIHDKSFMEHILLTLPNEGASLKEICEKGLANLQQNSGTLNKRLQERAQ